MRVAPLLAVCLLTGCAAVQDARFVLREAVVPDPAVAGAVDTSGWERAELDGEAVYLGAVLLAFGEGTLAAAQSGTDVVVDAATITLELSEEAAAEFSEVTAARVGQTIALVLDGRVLMAPTVRERIAGGRVQISGLFSRAEADALVAQIREATGTSGR